MNDGKAEWVDAVVVGSGFGGSVVACRLAEAQRSVCLLERGKRYPPGSFPRRPDEMARNFWDPGGGRQGLFDIWSFRHVESVVASGLGGGSLIYANVLIRKDERWFVRDGGPGDGYESWPVTREELDPHYDRAEKVLGAMPYPESHAEATPKTQAMRRAAGRLGIEWFRPNLAVSFAAAGSMPGSSIDDSEDNLHDAPRMTCRMCGECDIGCNYGSKNTLDYTYLTLAARAGAQLRDRCEVLEIAPLPGGFEVGYIRHEPQNEGAQVNLAALPRHRIRCRVLVLACGALGTTYLLLRNQRNFPALSPALGSRFCGNGDLLGFALDSADRLEPSLGPVITSTMRVPDERDGGDGRGFYLQDGGYPGFVDWLVESATLPGPVSRLARWATARGLQDLTGHPHSEVGAQVAALIGDGHVSAGALPMLGMGREVPNGRLRLEGDYLEVDWRDAMSREYFKRVEATMAAVTSEFGGHFMVNPSRYLHRVIAVHNLGGAPMGTDARDGVVDDHGEAFGHRGLFVADGAVMPGPVGPNPSLTIAALADRFSDRILERLAAESLTAP
jgi:cholesterol oxidase